jgi:hypothetical protein
MGVRRCEVVCIPAVSKAASAGAVSAMRVAARMNVRHHSLDVFEVLHPLARHEDALQPVCDLDGRRVQDLAAGLG